MQKLTYQKPGVCRAVESAPRTGIAQLTANRSLDALKIKRFKRSGGPGEIRTPDRVLRTDPLYPAELRSLGAQS